MNIIILLLFLEIAIENSTVLSLSQGWRKSFADGVCTGFFKFTCVNCDDIGSDLMRSVCDWTAGGNHDCHEVCKLMVCGLNHIFLKL